MISDISEAFEELARIVTKLKELDQWGRLARQESRPDTFLSFQPCDHLVEDLRIQRSAFAASVLKIKTLLGSRGSAMAEGELARWRGRLRELSGQVDQLELAERFIRP